MWIRMLILVKIQINVQRATEETCCDNMQVDGDVSNSNEEEKKTKVGKRAWWLEDFQQ
jgi:hypothetical protein